MSTAVVEPIPRGTLGSRVGRRLQDWAPAAVVFVAGIALWEGLVRGLDVQEFLLPPPSDIAKTVWTERETLWSAGWFTFQEAVGGWLMGCSAAILTALVLARWRILATALPFAIAANAIPIIAFAPITNNWFGTLSQLSKMVIAAVLCYFPVLVNTLRGLTSVRPQQIELMRSYGAAMTYNELAQVLETKNPDTGELYQLADLNVMKMSQLGTGALEDGVFVRGDWIEDEDNQDIARRFLKASFRGWIYCRDNPEDCLRIVLDNGPTLGEGHQRWQLNEINALIWPAPQGIGIMEPESWEITKQIALDGKVIKEPASDDAYRTDIAEEAVDELRDDDVDVTGVGWQKETVEVTEGGA
jgi:hypothetical protein